VTGVCSVLDVLRCMQLQQQSIVVDTAIDKVLNCNLSSKYALTGRLCMSQFDLVFYSSLPLICSLLIFMMCRKCRK